MSTGNSSPLNPTPNGKGGQVSVTVLLIGAATFVLFILLDTLQFIITGHESPFFQQISKAAGAVAVSGFIGAIVSHFIEGRSSGS